MNWSALKVREKPLHTGWQGDEIVVGRGSEVIDRLHADELGRVTLVHSGAGDSPAEVRAAVIEMRDRVVLLDAACGIVGRVLFERQSYWSERHCIYWASERGVSWPGVQPDVRWLLARPVPPYRRLAPAAAASLFERAELSGPHTWDQRKHFRIERRRLFPGRALGAAAVPLGAAG